MEKLWSSVVGRWRGSGRGWWRGLNMSKIYKILKGNIKTLFFKRPHPYSFISLHCCKVMPSHSPIVELSISVWQWEGQSLMSSTSHVSYQTLVLLLCLPGSSTSGWEGIPLVSAEARGSLTEDHPDKCYQPCHGLPAPSVAQVGEYLHVPTVSPPPRDPLPFSQGTKDK